MPLKKKPCPFYRHGLCTAPSLCKPTDAHTVPDRCLTELHETCRIYILAMEKKMFEVCEEKDRGFPRRGRRRNLQDFF